MHTRRLFCCILGMWLTANLFIWIAASAGTWTTDTILAAPDAPLASVTKQVGYDTVRKVTYTDWRLPNTGPVNGVSMTPEPFPGGYVSSWNGATDVGYNISAPGSAFPGSKGSEMAYLFYNDLGNKGYYDVNGVYQPGNGLSNTGPFSNFQPYFYWSGTEYAPNTGNAWTFTSDGSQSWNSKSRFPMYALAVRPGDVAAVPVPAAVWLLGSGLIGLAGITRKRKTVLV